MALFAFANCGVAWWQWRRAKALERSLQGQAPRS
jgi:hypothetical protein